MHYTIEEMKLEWPPEVTFPTQETADFSPPEPASAPVPEILPVANPLPVLSSFSVSSELGSLRSEITPPAPRPFLLVNNQPTNDYTHLGAVIPEPACLTEQPAIKNLLYLPLRVEGTQNACTSDGQVQLVAPQKLPPGDDTAEMPR